MAKAQFVIKDRFQKGGRYQDLLTTSILTDVCEKITGQSDYEVEFLDEVNKGRQAKLIFNNSVTYISFSENKVTSRNSSFQSFPSALINYCNEANKNKNICYYILPTQANIETDYFIFMYRLMKTVGTKFLNESERLSIQVEPFSSFEDIILHKNKIRKRNSGNNSSYITKSSNNTIQVFGKLYGANKYETSLLCLALYYTSNLDIELFEIEEGNLKKLPQSARDYLLSLDRFKIINATITMEETEFQTNDSLRSPRYIYNLLERLGDKKCAFCNCDIPQLIDGAHILPVAEIKDDSNLNLDEKLKKAIDGNNGIWLCKNHHKLLDSNILKINSDGKLKIKSDLDETSRDYIDNITSINQLSEEILTSKFIEYIGKRNEHIQCSQYNILA